MLSMIDFILDLFRDQNHAAAFVADPERAMADAGLSAVTSAQLASVAATAVPSLALGDGDPVVGLQRAVSNHYGFQGFDPNFAPPPTWAPSWAPQPDFSPSTDLASGNSILSPTTNIRDDHSFNLDFGDITLGDKTSAQGPGAVAIGGSNHGDIVSGEGAVLGNGNSVNNGDIRTGSHSNVAVGDHNGISEGNTTAGGDVLTSHDGTVIQTSGHGTTANSEGNVTSVHGNQTTTDIHGAGNTSGVDNSSTVVHTSTTTDNSVHDNSVHDNSVHDNSVHDNSVHDNASSYHSSVHNNTSMHETAHQNTGIETHLGF
jgi:hypothetical protein